MKFLIGFIIAIVTLKGIDLFITMRNKKKVWKSKYRRGIK